MRAWLRACPVFADSAWFGADFLKDAPEHFALVSVPSTLRIRENILGQTEPEPAQEQNFVLAYRAPYGQAVQQNLDNLQRFQDIATWIWEQNAARNLPEWYGGEITAIVPTITPAIMEAGTATARYEIRLQVIYHLNI